MKFEKWQALGNDYIVIEHEQLPFALAPGRIRALCAAHKGVGADGVVLISAPERRGSVARLRIFNPDGSEAEVSGNGAREAALYLRRTGRASADVFTVETAAGQLRPRVTSPISATIEMGRARVRSDDFPSGTEDGRGELTAHGRNWAFRHVQVGNPQCAIRVASQPQLEALDLAEIGPPIESHALFPNRTNVSWFAPLAGDRIRARIFERGVGETSASGTGAAGAAVAFVLDGGVSPVTVQLDGGELEVAVEDDMNVALTGWAVPVFRGELADEFVEELRALH
ncbi:MAG: diaminopimelate epimerase [Solirubrobacterales bacterium]|nr:diaminopimelate epimerase [Solirubrobacterales bacterium]